MMVRLALSLLVLCLLGLSAAKAQRLVASTSDPEVSITSTFAGDTITLFGTIEPETGATEPLSPQRYDMVIAVRGPVANHVVRRKESVFGIWINREQQEYRNFPNFFSIVSSAPLDKIADEELLKSLYLTFDSQTELARIDEPAAVQPVFSENLIRLKERRGLFALNEGGVSFLSPRFYSTRIDLPAFAPNGTYLAQTHLFQNGELIARRVDRFVVRTAGFERFVGDAARDYPLVYGAVCVLLAVFTGWLGGVAFRR
jgi:uncharacterized protein (TIGR02186 family)